MFILHLHIVVAVVSALNAEIDNHPCLDNNLSIITVWLANCTMFYICFCCCCSFSTSIHSITVFPTMHWEKETMIDEWQWKQQQRQQREVHWVVFIRWLKTSERAPKENEAEEWYSDISQALPIASKVHHNKNIECKQHECSLFAWKKCCGNTHCGLSLYCLLLFQFIKIFHWIPTNCITQRKNHIYTIQRSVLDRHNVRRVVLFGNSRIGAWTPEPNSIRSLRTNGKQTRCFTDLRPMFISRKLNRNVCAVLAKQSNIESTLVPVRR